MRREKLSVSGPGSRRCRGRKSRNPRRGEAVQLGGGVRRQPEEKRVCWGAGGARGGDALGKEKGSKAQVCTQNQGGAGQCWAPAAHSRADGSKGAVQCTLLHRARCPTSRPAPLRALRRGSDNRTMEGYP
ncbi:hypothetical protein HJG60_011316 [Phyllostomus discolor]|uniref:Uncharacterized protein n=1 Tax=Phyllostomus discolor TaxID=89673 RepID=A0A834A7M8_9CHIR|nr:hypothetical protein HJG60_011316 [Phyllostomus discolor]